MGRITRRNMMSLHPILTVKIFDVWDIDFMGPFPNSFGNLYILIVVNYMSKWVKLWQKGPMTIRLLSNS